MSRIKKTLSLLLAVIMVLSLSGCNILDYNEACGLVAKGQYAEASAMFKALEDYEDSAELAKDCDYQLARIAFKEAEYEQAIELFEALDGHRDSDDYIKQAEEIILKDTLVDSWVSDDIDLTEYVTDEIRNSLTEDEQAVLEYIEFEPLIIRLKLELAENGCFEMSYDKDVIRGTCENLIGAIVAALPQYMQDIYAETAAEYGLSLEELLAAYDPPVESVEEAFAIDFGISLEEYSEATVPVVDELVEYFSYLAFNGVYTVEDGEIEMTIMYDTDAVDYDAEKDALTIELELDMEGKERLDVSFSRDGSIKKAA